MASGEPVAWGLWNPATGKLDHRCYQREEAARTGAANQSNRWRTLVAVPLFLQEAENGWLPIETAPKDGTEFDAWDGQERLAEVWWYTPAPDTYGWAMDAWAPEGQFAPGWAHRSTDDMIFHARGLTHWRPIPEGPHGR